MSTEEQNPHALEELMDVICTEIAKTKPKIFFLIVFNSLYGLSILGHVSISVKLSDDR